MGFKKTILLLFVFGVLKSQLFATQYLYTKYTAGFSYEKGVSQDPFYRTVNNAGSMVNAYKAKERKGENPEFERRGSGMGSIKIDFFFPEKILSGSSFLLKCKIRKGDLKGAAWLTQQLPVNFDVVEPEVANAQTEYHRNTLNLMWEQVPNDSIIEINYKVLVNQSYGYLPISTVLYFGESGEEYLFDTHVLIDKVRPGKDLIVTDLSDDLPEKDTCLSFIALDKLTGHKSNEMFDKNTQINNFDNKIYSIQILAMKCNCDQLKLLKDKYNIDKEISIAESQNWTTYTIGKFKTVEEAYFYLNKLRGRGMAEAFIVGFKNDDNGMALLNQ